MIFLGRGYQFADEGKVFMEARLRLKVEDNTHCKTITLTRTPWRYYKWISTSYGVEQWLIDTLSLTMLNTPASSKATRTFFVKMHCNYDKWVLRNESSTRYENFKNKWTSIQIQAFRSEKSKGNSNMVKLSQSLALAQEFSLTSTKEALNCAD